MSEAVVNKSLTTRFERVQELNTPSAAEAAEESVEQKIARLERELAVAIRAMKESAP